MLSELTLMDGVVPKGCGDLGRIIHQMASGLTLRKNTPAKKHGKRIVFAWDENNIFLEMIERCFDFALASVAANAFYSTRYQTYCKGHQIQFDLKCALVGSIAPEHQ